MKNRFSSLARCSLLVFALLCGTSLYAQRTVTGTVLDGEMGNAPMGGATVQVKGTTTATMTEGNGSFSINAKNTDVLVISFIGYENKEVTVGNQSNIRVTLGVSAEALDEVVAIGYGTVKKSDLTGAVAVITSKDLTKQPAMNVGQALQGKASGVLVSQSGAPGADPTIRVRGVGSISKSPNPIYVVDGIIVNGIGNISSQDIETMQVLKDASSAAIYGANGANGVVIITTKRGKSGKTQVNFNAFGSFTLKPERYDVMDADEYSQFYRDMKYPNVASHIGAAANPAYIFSDEFREMYYGNGWQKGTDWQDHSFRNGYRQNYDLSISGGAEKSNYSISFGYMDEKGTIISSGAKRYNLRANSDFAIGKWVKVGENIAISRQSTQSYTDTEQTNIFDLKQSPLMPIYSPDKSMISGFETYQKPYYVTYDDQGKPTGVLPALGGYDDVTNIYRNTELNDKPNTLVGPMTGENNNFATNALLSAYLEVNFTDWLQYKFTPSADMSFGRNKIWRPAYSGNRSSGIASLQEKWDDGLTLGVENQFTFKKSFNDAHNLQVIAVHQMRKSDSNNADITVRDFNFPQLNTLSNYTPNPDAMPAILGGVGIYRMISYVGRAMYDYKGRYLFTASIRADGVSRFAPGNRWGYFPSVSAAWKLNEDLMPDVDIIDMLKLRFGWGQTGNSNIGDFQYLSRVSNGTNFSPVFSDRQQVVPAMYVYTSYGYPGIKWEAADMYNVGFDLNMLRNRLQLSAEYYIKQQNDLLIQVPVTTVMGLDGDGARPWMNLGKLRNQGFELNASWRDNIGKFSYGVSGNLTTIKNEVTALPIDEVIGGGGDGYTRTKVGYTIGELWGHIDEGIIQATDDFFERDAVTGQLDFTKYKFAKQYALTPKPGDIRFKDINNDGIVDDNDKAMIGKPVPDFTYSANLEFGWNGIDLSLFFYGVQNYDIFNSQRATMSTMNSQDMDHNKFRDYAQNYWRMDRPSTEYVHLGSNDNGNDRISTFWVEKGSFLRLKSLQLGYALPAKACQKMKISNARIYADIQNVFTITQYKGRDPEPLLNSTDNDANPLNIGYDNGVYPVPRAFSLGIQLSF